MRHLQAIAILLGLCGCGSSERSEAPEASPVTVGEQTPVIETSTHVEVEPGRVVMAEPREVGPELRSVGDLALRRLLLSREVEAREPVDPATEFEVERAPLYVFLDVANRGEASEVEVLLVRPDGERVGFIDLEIAANVPRWRTWARSNMVTMPGTWHAEVWTSDGELLGSSEFEVR
jgi:hypothetical protein